MIDCEVVTVGSPDTTLTKYGLHFSATLLWLLNSYGRIYKCIIAGISFILAIGFLSYGGLILVKIWEALTEKWDVMAKVRTKFRFRLEMQ